MSNSKIRLIVPTRECEENFDTHTPLGRSLSITPRLSDGVERHLFGMNAKRALGAEIWPLPTLFNIAIEEAREDPAILIFVHDDVQIVDYFWPDHVRQGLAEFDMIGLAGNRRRHKNQASWGCMGSNLKLIDRDYLSGTVAHSGDYGLRINCYGPSHVQVWWIDGLFMAVHSDTLINHNIRFDPKFAFHFYDADLCRQFEVKNLRVGTWGISVIHENHGGYQTKEWKLTYKRYLRKWKF